MLDKKLIVIGCGALVVLGALIMLFSGSSGLSDEEKSEQRAEIAAAGITIEDDEADLMGKEYQEKIAYHTAEIKQNKDDSDAYHDRGTLYSDAGQYNLAIKDFTQVIRIKPKSADGYFNRGNTYDKTSEFKSAYEDFTTALKYDKTNAIIYNNRGLTQLSSDRIESALRDFNSSIKYSPEFGKAHFNLGTVHERMEDPASALKDYNSAIKFTQDFNDTDEVNEDNLLGSYYRRAIVYIKLKKPESALKDINKVIEKRPESVVAYELRAAIHELLGKMSEASSDATKANDLGLQQAIDG